MQLKCLTLKNFKGVNATMIVDKLNLLVGPNGSGKTARLLAQTWAITGQTPLGGRPEDTAKLCGTEGCSVNLVTDEDFAWMRRLSIDHRTKKLSTIVTILGEDRVGVTESDAKVRQAVGDYAPMFDLNKFLDLSAEGKRQEVLRLCAQGAATPTDSSLADRIQTEWLKQELGEGSVRVVFGQQGMRDGLQRLLRDVGEARQHALKAAMDAIIESTGTAEGGLNAIAAGLDAAKAMMNAAKRQRDESHQAARRLSEQKAQVEVPAEVVEELTGKRDGLLDRRTEIVAQIANQRGRESARASLSDSLKDADRKTEAGRKRLAAAKCAELVPLCEAEELETAAAQIDVQEYNVQLAMERAAAARSQKFRADEQVRDAERELDQAEHERAMIAQRLCEAKESPWQRALALAVVLNEGRVQIVGWQKLYALIVENAKNAPIKELEEQFNAKIKGEVELQEAVAKLKQAAVDAESREWANEEEATKTRLLERTAQENRGRRAELLAKAKTIREAFTRREEVIAEVSQTIQDLQDERVSVERRLNELDAEGGHLSLDDLEEQHTALEREIVDLNSKIKQKQQYQTLEAELTRCIASAEREATMYQVCKGVCEAIRTVRETMMREIVTPLIQRMNKCLGRMGVPASGAYCDLLNPRGRAIFELGWIVDGERKVPLEAMSGGESVLFSVCLLLALIELADPPLKLLLIEAGALDHERLNGLLTAIESVQDRFSNAFVTTHTLSAFDRADWNVIALGIPEAVEATG